MNKLLNYILVLTTVLILMAACESSLNRVDQGSLPVSAYTTSRDLKPFVEYKATGELNAKWEGCVDENGNTVEEGGCGGEEDTTGTGCEHEDEEGGEGCQGARPAREFYLAFNAQLKDTVAKGQVIFQGTGDYEGIDFNGIVTWVTAGRQPNELFFGGDITGGTVDRGCFLFSVQDNGEGTNVEPDRMQYRLYGSATAPCHYPDHLPKGYPIAVYKGNLQVH